MTSALHRLGRWCAHRPWRVIALWMLAAAAVLAAGARWGAASSESIEIPGTESQRAIDLLEERYPDAAGGRARVVFATDAGRVTDPQFRSGAQGTLDQIRALPRVRQVIDPFGPAGGFLVSPDGRIAFAEIVYAVTAREVGVDGVDALTATAGPARDAGLDVAFGGPVVERIGPDDTHASELIGLAVAVIVLAVAFGSVTAMALPMCTSLVGLGVGLALMRLLGGFVEVTSVAPILGSMIGIAVGIDYSLFIVTRHRQQLAQGYELDESVARALATSGQAVVFAGVTVMIAILGLALIGIPLVAALGYAVSLMVAIAVLVAITLLPALLGLVGTRIDRLRVPGVQLRYESDHHTSRSTSARWARLVTRRPWPFLAAGSVLLVALAIPAARLELGWPDAGNLPPETTARHAYDLLAEGFGEGFNGPLLIAVDLREVADPPGALATISTAVAATPGVQFASPAQTNDTGDTAVIQVVPTTSPQDPATEDLVDRLRGETVPTLEADTRTVIEVTGTTAAFIDISKRLADRLAVFIGAVVLLSFLLLTAVFRSPLVALKAALVNLLGIAAAYGALVAVFQWGWGLDAVGLDETVPIVSFLPMMMFAILFGLSMDYEVFILSRVREEWVATGDPTGSVVGGIATSARVITAAALIMISVFASFVLGDTPEIKMFGFGLAVAVALDATVIRMVVVPATMTLLGSRNWWLPGWLDRILPNLDIEGTGTLGPNPAVAGRDAAHPDRPIPTRPKEPAP
ncbi:MAG TPA: MMPL family transporter [Microthrixaceae bacterium]|nr:MMPL family transporter [Microthrixaceae bacterium]